MVKLCCVDVTLNLFSAKNFCTLKGMVAKLKWFKQWHGVSHVLKVSKRLLNEMTGGIWMAVNFTVMFG